MSTTRTAILLGVLTAAGCKSSAPPADTAPPSTSAAAHAEKKTEQAPPAAKEKPVAGSKTAADVTRREEVVEEIFGEKVVDPYRWLEDEKSAEVKTWMQAKDAAARTHLAKLPERAAIAERLHALLYIEARTAPIKRGGRLFFTRRAKDQEKAVLFYQDGEKGEAKVLLDPNTLSADGSISLGAFSPSWDGKLIAYLIKAHNADEETLYVKEVAGGKAREVDTIEHLRYTYPSWAPDGSGFYYTWLPAPDPNTPVNERMGLAEIRFHKLGTEPGTDRVLHEKLNDPTKWMGAWISRDGKYLFLQIHHGWSESDLYVQQVKEKKPEWTPIAVGTPALYKIETWKDKFYIATNHDAPKWRVYVADPKKLDRKQWKEIVPEESTAVLDSFALVGGHLGLGYLENASSKLQIRTLEGKLVRNVELPAIGSISELSGLEDDDTAYFSFSSFLYPEEIYKTSVKSGKTEMFAKLDIPVDPSKFELEQVWYPSRDGTRISMFLLHAKGMKKRGASPTILSGYGGFGISMTPHFTPSLYAWLERGGVYAMPNLRGGGEYGEEWHRAGMLGSKQNVFDDFIFAAQWLINNNYTKPERLAAMGRSNGGLLVGAAMTQRPELFGAVVCGVPLLDMVRYAKVGVGKAWVPEYGDPEKEEDFEVLYGYSPYHHLEQGTTYPALLLLSADSDDRVDPMHARKFMAAIEAASAGERTKLLRIEMNAGHGGGDMRKKAIEQTADELAFLRAELGATEAPVEEPSEAMK